jgi:hypothetical protein
LRYALAFPKSSEQTAQQPETDAEWKQVYAGCFKLFRLGSIRQILLASYSGIYVDEYQDCSVEQHTLIALLADILPCRVLGDPLQGIFDFKDTRLVDWKRDVEPSFAKLPELAYPWRWKDTAPALGRWLIKVRQDLLDGRPVDLTSAPKEVTWVRIPANAGDRAQTRMSILKSSAGYKGTTVAILRWETECNALVKRLAPLYHNMETIACDDLMQSAEEIQSSAALNRMDAVLGFGSKCLTAMNQLETVANALKKGSPRKGRYTRQAEMDLLSAVVNSDSFLPVAAALEGLSQMPNVKVWRRELFNEMLKALRECNVGNQPTLKDAAWSVRNKTRQINRRLPNRVISRTVLVKGLQFDHSIVLDAESLGMKDLYVALTRGTRSVTVFSNSQLLKPAP